MDRLRIFILLTCGFAGSWVRAEDTEAPAEQKISIPDINTTSFSLPADLRVNDAQLAGLVANLKNTQIVSLSLADHREIASESLKAFEDFDQLTDLY
jgi:hypothetical protein